ncbi:DsbA family protein [Tropicimonas sediminicola]|uniref:Protein-disulfide isomerase n=1 Tax=Tropicimonas sediminicola TaxID=1031541 RepID=A0A239GN75_9RHOB|nr:DsbA family protein [Tropicimonas sediminicola]SNS70580.1 Protein-disulfide isomerase [Tropicimonas sediminicola]
MKALPLAAALAIGLAVPAAASDLSALTDAERDAFREEVRAYLLENPEVLMEAIAVLEQRQQDQQAQDDVALVKANAADLFESETSWVGGNPDGDVTIVEFTDYRCSYCRRAFPELDQLVSTDGNIRLILKEFPILGEQSVLSTRMALATRIAHGDEAYKAAHDALIAFRGEINDVTIRAIASDIGLEADPIIEAMDSPEIDAIIAENHALAQRMQISGTPTFVVGDQMLRGYLPLESMMNVVEQVREGS